MSSFFSEPCLLLLAPCACAGLCLLWRRFGADVPAFRRRKAATLALCGAAALTLILAAAGLQVPAHAPRQMLVIAADVSDSIFDLATQTTRLNETLGALDPETARAAVVVFGKTAGHEREMGPLALCNNPPGLLLPQSGRTAARPPRRSLQPAGVAPFVDLTRPATVVDRSATDIGNALSLARGLFPPGDAVAARGILVLSDFRETRGSASAAAAALAGSGVDLLTCPAMLGPAADVHLAALKVPDAGQVGRDVPIEVAVASQSPCTVRVSVWRWSHTGDAIPVDFKTTSLVAEAGTPGAELRKVVRVVDRPSAPGVAVYTARLSGPDGELPNDISINNALAAAAWITGPSRWAVLTRPGSTLAALCADKSRPLGVDTDAFAPGALPRRAVVYDPYAGIMVDGLSAAELPEGPALHALADAVGNGKALLAFGGERAFGAGGHRSGTWENLLPVEMTPEDDRTRSVLFVIDVSRSMDERMRKDGGAGVRKIDFAAEQLALAVQKLKPLDRLALVSFSGSAEVAAPLSSDPSRSAFLAAVKNVAIQSNTDLLPPLQKARELLQADAAEEQLVVLLSDGVQTAATPVEEIVQAAKVLCPPSRDPDKPRRTTLFTFGIGVDAKDANAAGEKLLKTLAETGGGTYSPEFLKLAERLENAFESGKKDFYIRREPFALRPACEHPLLTAVGGTLSPAAGTLSPVGGAAPPWPVLPFRNRVKAKPGGEVLLWSAAVEPLAVPSAGPAPEPEKKSQRPDPIVTLSGALWPGVSRRAALAVALDGAPGTVWFGSAACRRLLPALLEWTEAKTGAARPGWTVDADAGDDETIVVEVRARDPVSGEPLNGRKLQATLAALQLASSVGRSSGSPGDPEGRPTARVALHPSAPGLYRALLLKPAQGVYRLAIHETVGGTLSPAAGAVLVPVCERFVTVPYPAELRRFGTDRAAMQALVAKAGGDSRAIEMPQDLAHWAADKAASREMFSLRPWLICLGLLLLLAEYALRGRRT